LTVDGRLPTADRRLLRLSTFHFLILQGLLYGAKPFRAKSFRRESFSPRILFAANPFRPSPVYTRVQAVFFRAAAHNASGMNPFSRSPVLSCERAVRRGVNV
jgi:hypothetical protein